MKAALLGATGYTGLLLARLLAAHPEVGEIVPVSSSKCGEKLHVVDPGFQDPQGKIAEDGTLLSLEAAAESDPDVVFAALPHLQSAKLCAPFLGRTVIIDLSADFRLKNIEAFEKAYGCPPPRIDLLGQAVYGLPEWQAEAIRSTDLIANPGCYPTAVLLPLLPVARAGLIGGQIYVSAITGISGAGRKVKQEYLFCERSENACAYTPGKSHRHVCEMEEQLRAFKADASVQFVPHLAPLRKGMTATIMVPLSRQVSVGEIEQIFQDVYGQAPFVRLRGSSIPQTAEVRGSNRCDIGWYIEAGGVDGSPNGDSATGFPATRSGTLILFSVLDNLVKGASGQAVQNMNLRFGFSESSGLPAAGEI